MKLLIIFVLIGCLDLLVASGWEVKNESLPCTSCNWLFGGRENGPRFATYFVHMRKSGGSSLLRIFKSWMTDQQCANMSSYTTSGVHGIVRGIMLSDRGMRPDIPTSCPDVEMRHNEFSCIHPESLFNLPVKEKREHIPLSLVTYLRYETTQNNMT